MRLLHPGSVLACLLAVLLIGCGQKGPLYLPKSPAPAPTATPQTVPAPTPNPTVKP
jgi:predicted small lipoprotein YifL